MDLSKYSPLIATVFMQLATLYVLLRLSDILARIWACICGVWIGALAMPNVVQLLRGMSDEEFGYGYQVPAAIGAGAIVGCLIAAWLTRLLRRPSPPEPPSGDPFPGRGLLCFAGLIAGMILYTKVNDFLVFALIPNDGWGRFAYALWTMPLMVIGGAFVGFAFVRHRTSGYQTR